MSNHAQDPLPQDGEMGTQKKRGQKKGAVQARTQRRIVAVLTLIEEEKSFEEICCELTLRKHQLSYIYERIQQPLPLKCSAEAQEKIEHEKKRRERRKMFGPCLKDLLIVWSLHQKGHSLRTIGQMVHPRLSSHAILKRLNRLKGLFGPSCLEQDFITPNQAEKLVGISGKTIVALCRDGEVGGWSPTSQGSLVLYQESVAELFWLLGPDNQRRCANPDCDNMFTPNKRRVHTCSTQCSRRYGYHIKSREDRFINPGKTSHRNSTWQKELEETLKTHPRPEQEMWTPLREAVQLCGLNKIQIIWAGRTGLISTRKSSERMWRGQPVTLYATSELLLIKRHYKSWQRAAKQSTRSK